MANGGSDWIRTLTGAGGAITAVFVFGHLLIIAPMNLRQEKFESDLKEARKDVSAAYTLIQTNDQYKRLVEEWKDALRRDLERIESAQRTRSADVSSIPSLDRRISNNTRLHEELERRLASTYTLNDAIKELNDKIKRQDESLSDLRRRLMVPASSKDGG